MARSPGRIARHIRTALWCSVILTAALAGSPRAHAQTLFGLTIDELTLSAAPVWLYNGFTRDASGASVQGSQGNQTQFGLSAGIELNIGERSRLDPSLWWYLQEYGALKAYDKTVITQVETGSNTADIASLLTIALSVPYVYEFTFQQLSNWRFGAQAGLTLAFRIPVSGVEGSNVGAPAGYWIAGRFIYPEFGLSADYRFNDRWWVGAGLQWFVPLYNVWDSDAASEFLDETMIRYGLRLRRQLAPLP